MRVPESLPESLAAARSWYLAAVDALRGSQWQGPTHCAGWTPTNVVAHVAGGDYYVRALINDATGRDKSMLAARPADRTGLTQRADSMAAMDPARLRQGAHDESGALVALLVELLRQSPGLILRGPTGESTVSRWANVRWVEYVVHGHDLEPATGVRREVPPGFVDALPRLLEMFPRLHQRSVHKGKAASFHLHRVDAEGEWVVQAEAGQATSGTGHGRADVALRGHGEGLFWVLLGRGGPDENGVEVHGDPGLAAAFKEWFPGP